MTTHVFRVGPTSYEALVTAPGARQDEALALECVRGNLVAKYNRKLLMAE